MMSTSLKVLVAVLFVTQLVVQGSSPDDRIAVEVIRQAKQEEKAFEAKQNQAPVVALAGEDVLPPNDRVTLPNVQCAIPSSCDCLCVKRDMATVYMSPTTTSPKLLVAKKGTAFQDLGDSQGTSSSGDECGEWRHVRPQGGDEGWIQGCKVQGSGCACTCQPGRCEARPTAHQARDRCVRAVAAFDGSPVGELSEKAKSIVRHHCDNDGDASSRVAKAEIVQQEDSCPKYEGKMCNEHGACRNGKCECNVGFLGEACQWASTCQTCSAVGDTHFTTFDGLYFNFYSGQGRYGEYLAYARPDDPSGLAVSVTMPQVEAREDVESSYIKSVQVRRNGQVIRFDQDGSVTLNCEFSLHAKADRCPANGYTVGDPVTGIQVRKHGRKWVIDSPPGCAWGKPEDGSLGGWTSCDLHLELNQDLKMHRLAMFLGVCEPKFGDYKGLCGNINGVDWDDIGPAGKTWRFSEPDPQWVQGFLLEGTKASLQDCSGQFVPFFSQKESRSIESEPGENDPGKDPRNVAIALNQCDEKVRKKVEELCRGVEKRGSGMVISCLERTCTSLSDSCKNGKQAEAIACCSGLTPDDGRFEPYITCLEDTCHLGGCQSEVTDNLDQDLKAFDKEAAEAQDEIMLNEVNEEAQNDGYEKAAAANAVESDEA